MYRVLNTELRALSTEKQNFIWTYSINPFMHNVVNGQMHFKNLAVFTPQDF